MNFPKCVSVALNNQYDAGKLLEPLLKSPKLTYAPEPWARNRHYIKRFWSVFPAGVCSLFGNSTLLYVSYKKKHLLKPAEYFIINLAVSDLGLTLSLYPMAITSSFYHRYYTWHLHWQASKLRNKDKVVALTTREWATSMWPTCDREES